MPYVNKPMDRGSQKQSDKTFTWVMENVFHLSSKVIVGSSPGVNNYYPGAEKKAGVYTDLNVSHPGNNKNLGCFTRVLYYKNVGGAQYTDLSRITSFTSTSG